MQNFEKNFTDSSHEALESKKKTFNNFHLKFSNFSKNLPKRKLDEIFTFTWCLGIEYQINNLEMSFIKKSYRYISAGTVSDLDNVSFALSMSLKLPEVLFKQDFLMSFSLLVFNMLIY